MASTASRAFPPDSPRACCAASSRIASCSCSRISVRSRSRDERWANIAPSSSDRFRSSSFFSLARSSTLFSLSESWVCLAVYSSSSCRRRPVRRSSSVVRIRLFSISISCWWRMPERCPFFSSTSFSRAKSFSRAPSVSSLCCLISVSIFSSWAFHVAISIAIFVRSMVRDRIWSVHSATRVSARFVSM